MMISLGEVWSILSTAILALALESIWFSSLWLGSWLDTKGKADRFEDYSSKRIIITFTAYLLLMVALAFSLGQLQNNPNSLRDFIWPAIILVSVGGFISSLRVYASVKHIVAEVGFVVFLLTVSTSVLYLWPW